MPDTMPPCCEETAAEYEAENERLREALSDGTQVVMDALAALDPPAARRLMDTSFYRRFLAALPRDADA